MVDPVVHPVKKHSKQPQGQLVNCSSPAQAPTWAYLSFPWRTCWPWRPGTGRGATRLCLSKSAVLYNSHVLQKLFFLIIFCLKEGVVSCYTVPIWLEKKTLPFFQATIKLGNFSTQKSLQPGGRTLGIATRFQEMYELPGSVSHVPR